MTKNCIRLVVCALALGLAGADCVSVVNVDPDTGGDGGGGTDKVTLRLVNASPSLAVDVQLYAVSQAINNADTELFVPANQQVAGIGFAGSGLVPAAQTDEITLTCAQALAVGTLGGRFVDQNTGTQIGAGTRYVLIQGSQFQCGSTIIFTYVPTGTAYRTDVAVIGPGG